MACNSKTVIRTTIIKNEVIESTSYTDATDDKEDPEAAGPEKLGTAPVQETHSTGSCTAQVVGEEKNAPASPTDDLVERQQERHPTVELQPTVDAPSEPGKGTQSPQFPQKCQEGDHEQSPSDDVFEDVQYFAEGVPGANHAYAYPTDQPQTEDNVPEIKATIGESFKAQEDVSKSGESLQKGDDAGRPIPMRDNYMKDPSQNVSATNVGEYQPTPTSPNQPENMPGTAATIDYDMPRKSPSPEPDDICATSLPDLKTWRKHKAEPSQESHTRSQSEGQMNTDSNQKTQAPLRRSVSLNPGAKQRYETGQRRQPAAPITKAAGEFQLPQVQKPSPTPRRQLPAVRESQNTPKDHTEQEKQPATASDERQTQIKDPGIGEPHAGFHIGNTGEQTDAAQLTQAPRLPTLPPTMPLAPMHQFDQSTQTTAELAQAGTQTARYSMLQEFENYNKLASCIAMMNKKVSKEGSIKEALEQLLQLQESRPADRWLQIHVAILTTECRMKLELETEMNIDESLDGIHHSELEELTQISQSLVEKEEYVRALIAQYTAARLYGVSEGCVDEFTKGLNNLRSIVEKIKQNCKEKVSKKLTEKYVFPTLETKLKKEISASLQKDQDDKVLKQGWRRFNLAKCYEATGKDRKEIGQYQQTCDNMAEHFPGDNACHYRLYYLCLQNLYRIHKEMKDLDNEKKYNEEARHAAKLVEAWTSEDQKRRAFEYFNLQIDEANEKANIQ